MDTQNPHEALVLEQVQLFIVSDVDLPCLATVELKTDFTNVLYIVILLCRLELQMPAKRGLCFHQSVLHILVCSSLITEYCTQVTKVYNLALSSVNQLFLCN